MSQTITPGPGDTKWEIRSMFMGGHPMLNLAESGEEAWSIAAGLLKDARYRVIVIAAPDGVAWHYPDAPPVAHDGYYPVESEAAS